MAEANYKKATWIEILTFGIMTFFIFGFALFIGLAWGGFSESFKSGASLNFGSYLTNLIIYLIFGFVTLGNIVFPITKLITLKDNQHPATASNPKWYRIFTVSYLHSPEENGILPNIFPKTFKWLKNPLKTIWYSILFFSAFGVLILFNSQIALVGTPQLGFQQVTPLSEIGFKALIPSWTENGVLIFFFQLFSGIGAYFISKKIKNKNLWFGWNFIMAIMMGFLWMGFHSIVYANSETSLISTFIFGFTGILATLLTGSCLPFFVYHFVNNTFLVLKSLVLVSEDLKFISIVIWVIITALTIFIARQRRKNKKAVDGIPN